MKKLRIPRKRLYLCAIIWHWLDRWFLIWWSAISNISQRIWAVRHSNCRIQNGKFELQFYDTIKIRFIFLLCEGHRRSAKLPLDISSCFCFSLLHFFIWPTCSHITWVYSSERAGCFYRLPRTSRMNGVQRKTWVNWTKTIDISSKKLIDMLNFIRPQFSWVKLIVSTWNYKFPKDFWPHDYHKLKFQICLWFFGRVPGHHFRLFFVEPSDHLWYSSAGSNGISWVSCQFVLQNFKKNFTPFDSIFGI